MLDVEEHRAVPRGIAPLSKPLVTYHENQVQNDNVRTT